MNQAQFFHWGSKEKYAVELWEIDAVSQFPRMLARVTDTTVSVRQRLQLSVLSNEELGALCAGCLSWQKAM